jgi:sugar/nucleoside kinase (ribokinase family)
MGYDYDVLTGGDYCIDYIFTGLPKMPDLGEEVRGNNFSIEPGESCNSVIAMHRLGIKIGWAADFGTDEFSRTILKKLKDEGIDERLFIHHKKSYQRITISASFTKDRAFITYYDKEPYRLPALMKKLPFVSAKIMFIPGFYTGSFFSIGSFLVKKKKMLIVMDGNHPNSETVEVPAVRKTLEAIDIVLPNAKEVCQMSGKNDIPAAARELGRFCPMVIVKDGPNGSWSYNKGKVIHVPGIKVNPIDTTGAGDNYNAGFLKAYLVGRPLAECLKWGNITGGLSTEALGGPGRKITQEDVKKYLLI